MSDLISELRELTSSGRERIAEAQLRAEIEAQQKKDEEERKDKAKADHIISFIPERCRKEALAGRDFAIVMGVKHHHLDNMKLIGAPALVWKHCVEEGLAPTLEHWHDGVGIKSGHNIVVHW